MHFHSQPQFPHLQRGLYIIIFIVYNEKKVSEITGNALSLQYLAGEDISITQWQLLLRTHNLFYR